MKKFLSFSVVLIFLIVVPVLFVINVDAHISGKADLAELVVGGSIWGASITTIYERIRQKEHS